MAITGGCYCGAVRYEIDGEPGFPGQCFCRECQKVAGGGASHFIVATPEAIRYVKGAPKRYQRADLEAPVVREFCAECGVQLTSRAPRNPTVVLVKVGSLDDPSIYRGPKTVFFAAEAQAFHLMPPGVKTHQTTPIPRR